MLSEFSVCLQGSSEMKQILDDYDNIVYSIAAHLAPPQTHSWAKSFLMESLEKSIEDRDRKASLWLLCFVDTGDFDRMEVSHALPLAARNDWPEVVSAIVEMGGSIDVPDRNGMTAVTIVLSIAI